MIAARRVLVVSADGLVAWLWAGGRASVEARFVPVDGTAGFAAYLNQHRRSRFYLLADIADETFHQEDLPHTRGSERIAMLRRKIDRHCSFTALAAAMYQGRRGDGRRDDRFLFAALARPNVFAPWREALAAADVDFAGIYSAPQVVAALAATLAPAHPARVLTTFGAAGLRQTYFADGRLRFSRLTPLAAADDAASRCAAEAANLHHYLAGRRLIARDAPLAVAVLAPPDALDTLRAQCRDNDDLKFEFLDHDAIAHDCGLRDPQRVIHIDALLVHLLLRATPTEQFAPDDDLIRHRQHRLRRRLAGIAAGLTAAALAGAGLQVYELYRLGQATAELEQHTSVVERQLKAMPDGQSPLPAPAESLAALTRRHEILVRKAVGPLPLYRELGAALDAVPDIDIRRLDWAIVARANDAPGSGATSAIGPVPAGAALAAAPVVAGTAVPGYAVIDIHGTLPLRLADDPPGQQTLLDAFVAKLRQPAGIEVRPIELPADHVSRRELRGNDEANTAHAPQFILRASRPL